MEEKHLELSKEQVSELKQQYWDITADLKKYRRLFWQRRFWRAPDKVRKDTKRQYKFMKFSINELILTLCFTDNMDGQLAASAILNRFVTWKTRYIIIQNIQQWTMQH